MNPSSLSVEDRGPVRWITFNRPDVHNAQDVAMLESLDLALDDTARSGAVRVLVIAGAGRSFCSGHDLKQISVDARYRANASTAEGRHRQEARLFSGPVQKLRELRIPVVCRIQGYCLAAGLMFAGAADFVVASEDAQFGSPVLRAMGVNDAEFPSFLLRVPEMTAKRVIWLGEYLDAREAREAGLVTWVVPATELDAKVADVAERLVGAPPEALALSKDGFLFMAERRGERDISRYHYISHQFSHQTAEAGALLDARVGRVEAGRPVVPEWQRR